MKTQRSELSRRKIGRPRWTPPDLAMVEDLAAKHLTQQQIADALGIHVGTLYAKKNEFAEFDEAIKRGKAKGLAKVADALAKQIENGNIAAIIFTLKCQAGWRESMNIALDIDVTKLSDEQLAAIAGR